MIKWPKTLLLVALLVAGGSGAALAQQVPQEEPLTRPRTGVGVQLTWPTYGLSGMLDLGENLSVQGVVGTFRGLSITGRGLYRFAPQELFIPFAYGALGYSTGDLIDVVVGTRRAGPHFGGGAGIEADVRTFLPDLPPIFVNLEAGVLLSTWTNILGEPQRSTHLLFGPAVHYRF